MAESGRLASELSPTGTAVSCPSSLPAETLEPGPQTPVCDGPDPPTNAPLLPPEDQVQVSREPLKEDSQGGSSEHTGSSGSGSVGKACAQVAPHRTSARPLLEHSVGPRPAVNPHGTAETYTSAPLHQGLTTGANNGLHVGGGYGGGGISSVTGSGGGVLIQSLQPASLPVQGSPSETPQVEVCGHTPQGSAHHAQKAQGQVEVVCKPSPQLQRCSVLLTAAYHHDAGGPTRLLQEGSGHMCAPRGGSASEDCVVMENQHLQHQHLHHQHHQHQQQQQQQCEEPICYGSYPNHGILEDSFPACCHPQPLLTPAHLPLCMADVEAACQYQAGVLAHAHPEASLLALPRLISSVSETGLDAKRLLGCCSLGFPWVSPSPAGGFHGWTEECHGAAASCPISPVAANLRAAAALRDAGTMTARQEVRDVGVQTSLPTPPHVFPQVCLVEEAAAGTAGNQEEGGEEGGPGGVGGHNAKRGSLKSPVKEVKWDAEGMTWEVYGASVDPEELGLAIQRHLELQIKETASRAAKLSRQGTATSRHSCAGASGKECGKKRGRVTLGLFRPPACCARTTTAVD